MWGWSMEETVSVWKFVRLEKEVVVKNGMPLTASRTPGA